MVKNRVDRGRGSQTILWACMLAILGFAADAAQASVLNSCTTYCHGMPPRDSIRKANPHFDSQSSAFLGNHRNHLSAAPASAECNICHTSVASTDFGHENEVITMANSLKGYSSANIRAKYDKGRFFNQTSIPNLTTATCSNVNCHFETKTPAWGSAAYTAPANCDACHGFPPAGTVGAPSGGLAGSHTRHDTYFPGTVGCQKCHPAYAGFAHATSTGHPLKVQGFLRDPLNTLEAAGTYSGNGLNYLPSKSGSQLFGSCNNIYCHSSAQGATGTGAVTYLPATWGGSALTCGSCHKNMASDTTGTGSHQLHATSTATTSGTGVNYTCQVCHGLSYSRSRTPAGGTHVNRTIELGFSTISAANAAGTTYGKTGSFAPGTAYGQCSTSNCHGSGKPVWGANTTRPVCFKCHGSTVAAFTTVSAATVAPGYNGEGRDTGGNTLATSPRVGAHQTHLTGVDNISGSIHCGECHTTHLTVKDATHLNYSTATITFGPLAKTASHTPSVSRTTGVISCSNTYCHTGNRTGATAVSTTPVFTSASLIGNTSITDTCINKCHGMPPGGAVAGDSHAALTASGTYTTPASLSACSSQTGGSGCHPTLNGAPTSMATIFFDKTKHVNGQVEGGNGHIYPYPGSVHDSLAVPITNCTSCHTNVSGTYPVARGTKPDCRSCHKNASPGTAGAGGCSSCHGRSTTGGTALNYSAARPNGGISGAFPNYSGSHTKHVITVGLSCDGCHNGYGTGHANHGFSNTSGATYSSTNFKKMSFSVGGTPTYTRATKTCSALTCHGTAIWGGRLGCTDCHAVAVTSPKAQALDATVTTRGAVVGEFTNTWSHKRSFTGTPKVVDADCIVCHMEGIKGGGTAAVHADGYVNLRDPDTGANIKNVTFGGTNAGSYTEGATDVTFVRFKRDFSKRLERDANFLAIAAVQQLHCLKCHDTAGATNANAQVPTTGTALKPFGVTITGHAAPFDSNGSGNVVDVNKSFLVSNSSYHPVRGRQNNWFAKYSATDGTTITSARMNGVYKGPYANRGASANATTWGYLISCWDCHTPAGSSGVVTRSVTAHGAAATLRGTIRAAGTTAATNLCVNCHNVAYATTGTRHNTNSAFTQADSAMGTTYFNNCSYCHAYSAVGVTQGTTAGSTSTLRPLRAEDAHGFNDRTAGTVGSKWATSNIRPYGFMRNSLSNFAPNSTTASGETISGNTRTCQGTGGTCNNNMDGAAGILGVGGTY